MTSVNDAITMKLSEGSFADVSDDALMAMVPHLFRCNAPLTKLVASPFEDLFVLRAAVGDFEDVQ